MHVTRTLTILGTILLTSLHAEEGGAGHYVPGSMATLIDLPPTKPGWVIESVYLRYEGSASASRNLPIGGLLAANLDATSDAALLGGFYTFDDQVAGAWYSVGGFLPYVWMDATATVGVGPLARAISDSDDGLGDITLIPLLMGWKCGDWQYNAALPIYAPTGNYEVGRLANTGRNYWTFDPTIGISYNGATNGLNAALHTGFAINTENNDTNYQSGTVWHTELSVQQLLPVGPGFLGIGFNAFYYDQITGDSGSGARLGDFEGRTSGIGPVISYVLPVGENTFVAEARWLPEFDTQNRLEGDYFWLKLIYQF
ncbi:SphA family protein [Haloferula sp.]|uniref:SphA family protein n=1 Tax=Haloferula sp. TaxID=2497595 RepID=UPI003C712F5E